MRPRGPARSASGPTRRAVAHLVLRCDGRPVAEVQGTDLEYRADRPGVYRVEALHNRRPWVYTNPIYLRSGARPAAGRWRNGIMTSAAKPKCHEAPAVLGFDTPVGRIQVAATARGLVRVVLPSDRLGPAAAPTSRAHV